MTRFGALNLMMLSCIVFPICKPLAANTLPNPQDKPIRQILAAPFSGSYTGQCLTSPDGQKADGTMISFSDKGANGAGLNVDFTNPKTEMAISRVIHLGKTLISFSAINHNNGTDAGLTHDPESNDIVNQVRILRNDGHQKDSTGVWCRNIPSFVDDSFEPLSLVQHFIETPSTLMNCMSPTGQMTTVAVSITNQILSVGDQKINLTAARDETTISVDEIEKLTLGLVFADQKQLVIGFKKQGFPLSILYTTKSSMLLSCVGR